MHQYNAGTVYRYWLHDVIIINDSLNVAWIPGMQHAAALIFKMSLYSSRQVCGDILKVSCT